MTTQYIAEGGKLLKSTRCAMAGQAQNRFSFGFDEKNIRCIKLKIKLLQQISILYEKGIHIFLTDCSLGVSMWSAEIVAGLMSLHHDIKLFCVIPYEEQAAKWPTEYRNRYYSLQESCTQSILLCTGYTANSLLLSSRYIINECDVLLTVCDYHDPGIDKAAYMVRYAKQANRSIIYINPTTLAVISTISVA